MYRPVPRGQIADALVHLRGLFRQMTPSDERETRTHEKREVVTRNLLSNLARTNEHPTLHAVLEIADVFPLTLDGAHQLFGYNLAEIREYDFRWNGGRTRIIESYPFDRDLLIDLPSQFGSRDVLGLDATLRELVPKWHTEIPIRTLENEGWQQPGAFYVQIGTEDSLGSSLPPGSIALVEPITERERKHPNPRAIYLLQFGNGYRCNRCVVTQGKLLLLLSARSYRGPQEFAYPGAVRIAGRIRVFALGLPVPDYPLLHSLPASQQNAPLVLPWEHLSMDRLFAAKHRRFQRPSQDQPRIREALETVFHKKLSPRTERRYRHPTRSQPHVDALIQLAVVNMARYTDSLRAHHSLPSDIGRFSLDALLHAGRLGDVPGFHQRVHLPRPSDVWEERRKEFVEWPTLLSINFPHLQSWDERVVRLSQGSVIDGLDPSLSPGSLLVLERVSGSPYSRGDVRRAGWARTIYALRRGAEFLCGHLERDGDRFALVTKAHESGAPITFGQDELPHLSRIAGVAIPV